MPPADPIRDRIVDDLATVLGAMTAGADYHYTTNSTFKWRTPGPEGLLAFPAWTVLDVAERVTIKSGTLQHRVLTVLVQGIHMVPDGADPDGVGRKLMADAQKALLVDHTRGGIAVDTDEVGNRLMVDAPAAPYLVVELDVEVQYRTSRGDPASNTP